LDARSGRGIADTPIAGDEFDLQVNSSPQFESNGDTSGHFARPKGMAADSNGHIYVVDAIFDNFQFFNDGKLLLNVGETGKGPAASVYPTESPSPAMTASTSRTVTIIACRSLNISSNHEDDIQTGRYRIASEGWLVPFLFVLSVVFFDAQLLRGQRR